jgi:ankyrin repeat protein
VFRTYGRALAASAALAIGAVPAAAQQYSDSFTFLKAVKDRDGTKVTDMIGSAGTTVVNTRDRTNGEGALHYVVRDRRGDGREWLSFLIGKGANVNIQNNRGETPLLLAAQIGWLDGADLLLQRRATVDLPNQRGETALIVAVQRRDLPMVRLLLAKGANPKKTDNVAGLSALDYARQDSRSGAILKLLEAKPAPAKPIQGPKL